MKHLAARFDAGFFKSLPQLPGVYLMIGLGGQIIYVGKAKNLRARLQSYRRARAHQVSRKVIRLIHCIEEIRYEICESEVKALLRENELLRLHRPVFNVVNTSPERYLFIGVRKRPSQSIQALEFRLSTRPIGLVPESRASASPRRDADAGWGASLFFGAFKGGRRVREGFQALLRLLWATQCEGGRMDFPSLLTRKRVPRAYEWRVQPGHALPDLSEWLALIGDFLEGQSDELLARLTEALLCNDRIQAFQYHLIQADLDRLKEFYLMAPARNREICRVLGLKTHLIPQLELDDLLVLSKEAKRAKGEKGAKEARRKS